jgi:hypothetical protein
VRENFERWTTNQLLAQKKELESTLLPFFGESDPEIREKISYLQIQLSTINRTLISLKETAYDRLRSST